MVSPSIVDESEENVFLGWTAATAGAIHSDTLYKNSKNLSYIKNLFFNIETVTIVQLAQFQLLEKWDESDLIHNSLIKTLQSKINIVNNNRVQH